MDWTTEELWFNAQQGEEIYLFSKACRISLGAHPASYSEGTGSPLLRKKLLECEADPSPPAKH